MLTDCHTHLDSFTDEEVGEVLGRARDAGVGMAITAGTTLASSERAVELTALYPELFAGVGMHPMDLDRRDRRGGHVRASSTSRPRPIRRSS